MILVDTSIWVSHFRATNQRLANLLQSKQILAHPWVIGELALGGLSASSQLLLEAIPMSAVATHAETMLAIKNLGLVRVGVGYVDANVLTSAKLMADTVVWTGDERLAAVVARLGLAPRFS